MTPFTPLPLPVGKESFTMGEVSQITGVKPTVLRYWESSFKLLRPARRGSGHRRFSRQDVGIVLKLRELIFEKRLTLAGAKKYLKDNGRRRPIQTALAFNESSAAVSFLKDVRQDITELVRLLKSTPLSS